MPNTGCAYLTSNLELYLSCLRLEPEQHDHHIRRWRWHKYTTANRLAVAQLIQDVKDHKL